MLPFQVIISNSKNKLVKKFPKNKNSLAPPAECFKETLFPTLNKLVLEYVTYVFIVNTDLTVLDIHDGEGFKFHSLKGNKGVRNGRLLANGDQKYLNSFMTNVTTISAYMYEILALTSITTKKYHDIQLAVWCDNFTPSDK